MRDALTRFARGVSWAAQGLFALLNAALTQVPRENDSQLHDAEMVGEYNHRTGRLDAGTDPYGWYEED